MRMFVLKFERCVNGKPKLFELHTCPAHPHDSLSLLSACRPEKKEPVKKEELGVKEDESDDSNDDEGGQDGDDSGASLEKEDADVRDFRYALENLKYVYAIRSFRFFSD